jgi:hypothetical protein
MNRYIFFGVIAGIATFLTIFGYWAKITHQAYADKTLTIGLWTLAICAGIYVYLIISNGKKK